MGPRFDEGMYVGDTEDHGSVPPDGLALDQGEKYTDEEFWKFLTNVVASTRTGKVL